MSHRHVAWLILLVALLLTGCTATTTPANPHASQTSVQTLAPLPVSPQATAARQPWESAQPPSTCAITRSGPNVTPPAPIEPTVLPVPWVRDWYGNDALWVRLPPTGVLPAEPESPGFGTKFPWWRTLPGKLLVTAQRLDGPTGSFTADIPDGYGNLGFQVSGLGWSAPGCWRVTGTVQGHSLTFTVWVQVFGP
jgi:hypothetical protein